MGRHKRDRKGESQKAKAPRKPEHNFPDVYAEGINQDNRKHSASGSTRLPRLKLREIISLLEKMGYSKYKYKKHLQMRGEGLPNVSLPSTREVVSRTLMGIIKQMGMSKEEFVRFYEEHK